MITYAWSVGDDDDANGGCFDIKEGHDWPELIARLSEEVKDEAWVSCADFTITCRRTSEPR